MATSWSGAIGSYSGPGVPCNQCNTCKHFTTGRLSGGINECECGTTDCAANDLRHGNPVRATCGAYLSPSDYKKQEAAEGAMLDRRPRPKLAKLLIIGLIVSAIWAAGIVIHGKMKTDLVIDSPLILTLLCGVPAGTVAFTLLRLLKNIINRGATSVGRSFQTGGNLFGWIIATFLPWVSPAIIYFVLASFVFHTKIF